MPSHTIGSLSTFWLIDFMNRNTFLNEALIHTTAVFYRSPPGTLLPHWPCLGLIYPMFLVLYFCCYWHPTQVIRVGLEEPSQLLGTLEATGPRGYWPPLGDDPWTRASSPRRCRGKERAQGKASDWFREQGGQPLNLEDTQLQCVIWLIFLSLSSHMGQAKTRLSRDSILTRPCPSPSCSPPSLIGSLLRGSPSLNHLHPKHPGDSA